MRVDMSAWRVLWLMSNPRVCAHTGVSLPECCCRECCRALMWHYAPALVDAGPLDSPCPIVIPAIQSVESYANAHGISENQVRLRASQLEVQV
jgi:hypothetical protein